MAISILQLRPLRRPFVLTAFVPPGGDVGELHGTILPPFTLSGSIYVTHYTTGRITPPLTLLGSQFTTTLAGNIRPTQQPGGSSQ